MDEEQVTGLMEVNDALLKAGTIDAAAHTRNKEAIVASFVEGLGPPLLEGQGSTFPTAKSTSRDSSGKHKKRKRRHSVAMENAAQEEQKTDQKKKSSRTRVQRGKSESDVNPSISPNTSPRPRKSKSSKSRRTDKGKDVKEEVAETKYVSHPDWFREITGCDEKPFSQTRDRSIFEPKDYSEPKKYGPLLHLKSQLDDHITVCGQFKMYMYGDLLLSLGVGKQELRKQTERSTAPCLFEIVTRTDDLSLRFVDVAHLQTLKENHNAVFQIASNFNAVEAINELSPPDREKFTEMYHFDRTQGPAASISAGSGAIARVHAPFYNQKKPHATWAQSASHQLNFVQDKKLQKHFPVTNGYVIYSGNEPKFPKEGQKKYKKLLAQYLVAYHRGQQVVYGHRTPEAFEVCPDREQRVDQVCCAAVNMLQGRTGLSNKDYDPKRTKMAFILQALYNSTYMSAIFNGREKIYLTLVGGGAFGNEIPAILEAITNAHIEWSKHSQSKLKKVVLVLFSPRPEVSLLLQNLVDAGSPVAYTIYTKGEPEAQPVPEKSTVIKEKK